MNMRCCESWRWICGCVFGVLLATPAAAAPAPAPATTAALPALDVFALAAPSFTVFTERDGLPDAAATTLATDHDGFTWAGTTHGIARYDGKSWHKVRDDRLASFVDQLLVDHAGTLWAASRDFGLARRDGATWQLVGPTEGLDARHVRRLAEVDIDGIPTLHALTATKGIYVLRDGRWRADAGNAQLPSGALLSLAETHAIDGAPRMWVGTGNSGLWFREAGGPWQHFDSAGFTAAQIEGLQVSHDGDGEALWIAAFGQGVWRLDAHGLKHWSVATGDLQADAVYNVVTTRAPDGSAAAWVASRAGLIRIYHDHAATFGRRYGLPTNSLRRVVTWRSPDGDDVLWLATEAGVARSIIGGGSWHTASLLGGDSIGVFGLLIDSDDHGGRRLWIASAGEGLGVYADNQWHTFSAANGGLPSSDVSLVARADALDGTSTVWVGAGDGDLYRVRGGYRFEPVTVPWLHRPGQSVSAMVSRRVEGAVEQWFGTRGSGLYRHRADGWTIYPSPDGESNWSIRQLLATTDATGRAWLWASSDLGLARFDGHAWTLLGRKDGLPDSSLIGVSLLPDAAGRPILWLGSEHAGIIRLDISDPMAPKVLPSTLPPSPDPAVYTALRDRAGNVFVCTNSGVQVLMPTAKGYASRVFTKRDGLINDECNNVAQVIDRRGRYWAGTLGGLSVYDSAGLRADRHAKPLHWTSVTIDGRPVAGAAITIPPGNHDLRAQYALLSWRQESGSQFRTFLEGFDAEPGAWGSDNFRDFGSLPPGRYALRVEGRDYAGNVSTPLTLAVRVTPEWWQRRWAWLALALAVLGLGYALLRWRTRALQHRQRELEAAIAARTRELRAANQRLVDIAQHDALTGLYNRRYLTDHLQALVTPEATSTALISIDVDHFKEYNDTYGHPAGDQALCRVAVAMSEAMPNDGIVARFGGEEFSCLLPACDGAAAMAVAERIQRNLAERGNAAAVDGFGRAVTISAGVAARPLVATVDVSALIRDADDALYRAKRDGRNCVRGADDGRAVT